LAHNLYPLKSKRVYLGGLGCLAEAGRCILFEYLFFKGWCYLASLVFKYECHFRNYLTTIPFLKIVDLTAVVLK
jgi:hypothetical protein